MCLINAKRDTMMSRLDRIESHIAKNQVLDFSIDKKFSGLISLEEYEGFKKLAKIGITSKAPKNIKSVDLDNLSFAEEQ